MKLVILLLWLCAIPLPDIASASGKDKINENEPPPELQEQMRRYLAQAEKLPDSEPQKAISLANKVISYATRYGDKELLAKAELVNGYAYGNYGDFVTGFEYVLNAMDNCPAGNPRLYGKILLKLSRLYIYLRELNRAFEYSRQALDIANTLPDSAMLASCYNTVGLINIHVPDIELAEQNFLKAVEINRKIGNRRGMVKNLNNLALYKGDTRQKIAQLQEAIAVNKELGATWSLAENYNNLGRQYYFSRNYPLAEQAFSVAREYAGKIGAKELIQDNNRYFADMYSARGKFREAYSYLKRVLNEVEREKMAEHIRKYETDLVQKRLDTTKQTIREKEQAYSITKMKYAILIVVLLFSTLFLISVYLVYRFRQRRKIQIIEDSRRLQIQQRQILEKENEVIALKLAQKEDQAQSTERELQHIRDELINTAFFVRSRGEMLANIQSQIRETYRLPEEKKSGELHAISRMISRMHAKNNEIDLYVDKISSEFIFKLSEKYPHLTEKEKRLASLLRIGLSTKEIASVTGAQPKTVDMARYRLRKKMELDSDEGLHTCLSRI